jgi:DUF1009 family protein
MDTLNAQKLGLIAGNGKFPFLVLEAAKSQGLEVIVAAIREETSPDIERHGASSVHWLSLGELSKLIEVFQRHGVRRAIMAGQVKHRQIFSSIKPDWRLAKLLLSLATRNTDSLIGAIAQVLESEGITVMSSTALLEPMLADDGVMTSRAPSDAEQTNITYGRAVAQHLSRFDIGQTVVVAEAACVAVEAMEGTDATILRAGELMKSPSLGEHPSTLSRALTVIKVAKPNQDMRFDVPVVGTRTIEIMKQAGATCLALDARRCLMFDKSAVIAAADAGEISIVAEMPVRHIPGHSA